MKQRVVFTIIIIRHISFVCRIIITNSYRDIETVIPECIARYTHIKRNGADIVRL